uniref:Uncharacterized protein n=1 Tax=Phytophthora ramorum TaxID=164328 RepID=H3HDC4_PHYRM
MYLSSFWGNFVLASAEYCKRNIFNYETVRGLARRQLRESDSLFASIDRESELMAFAIGSIVLKLTLQEVAKRYLLSTKDPLPRRMMIILVSTPTILVDTQVRMLLMRLQDVKFSVLGSAMLAIAEISYMAMGCSYAIMFFFWNHPQYQFIESPSEKSEATQRFHQFLLFAFQVSVEVVVDFIACNIEVMQGIDFNSFDQNDPFLTFFMSVLAFASSSSSSSGLNGWYPCSESTFSDEGGSEDQDAECAVYSAPLCYPGICETPESVDSNVDIFVKRVPAVNASESAPNVWIMQGGPGASSTAMESAMVELHTRLDGAVNVYTMDHRGTGRSTLLDCVAAQATTTGSPRGSSIDVSEVPACAEDLEKKYGNLSSFSMTSAATDMATFISNYSNGADTIVYAVSYGTALAERLIHLNCPEVIGYVLDGVATSSGASGADKFEYFSTWDADFGDVGDAFMALCATESECSDRFKATSLRDTLQNLITHFDNNPNSACAALSSDPASYILREAMGSLLQSESMRTLIPPVVYRLNRCASTDIEVLAHFFTSLNGYLASPDEENAFESTLLYYLIVFSEMWETPEPSAAEMFARFTNTRISDGGTYSEIPEYCAFSKERSPVCNDLEVGNYSANGLIYERDEYWNKSATIPDQASVLLLSSKLDPQTPQKYAEYLLSALDGDKKELITFDFATHGALAGGDLGSLDTSCVGEVPAFNLTVPLAYQHYFLSTGNVYDGIYDASLSTTELSGGSSKESTSYKAAFLVFLVLFVVALALAAFFLYRWYKLKSLVVVVTQATAVSGVCKTPASLDSTVDIFVKRVPAATGSERAMNVWLLQGGPGASSTAMCDQLKVGDYDANGIIYERDGYWNKSASVPKQASVLLLSSKLDPQTPHKYAEYLLGALNGDKKELVTFEHATHGTLWTTPTDQESETCGMKLLVSSKDSYDGVYDASLSASLDGTITSNSPSTYKTVFIVFLVLFVAALVLAGFFAYHWHKLKREKTSTRATDDLPENIEISTPPEVAASSRS